MLQPISFLQQHLRESPPRVVGTAFVPGPLTFYSTVRALGAPPPFYQSYPAGGIPQELVEPPPWIWNLQDGLNASSYSLAWT